MNCGEAGLVPGWMGGGGFSDSSWSDTGVLWECWSGARVNLGLSWGGAGVGHGGGLPVRSDTSPPPLDPPTHTS